MDEDQEKRRLTWPLAAIGIPLLSVSLVNGGTCIKGNIEECRVEPHTAEQSRDGGPLEGAPRALNFVNSTSTGVDSGALSVTVNGTKVIFTT